MDKVPEWLVWTSTATTEFSDEQEARDAAASIGGVVFKKSEASFAERWWD